MSGLNISEHQLEELFEVNNDNWIKEMNEITGYLSIFGDRLPKSITEEVETLVAKLKKID